MTLDEVVRFIAQEPHYSDGFGTLAYATKVYKDAQEKNVRVGIASVSTAQNTTLFVNAFVTSDYGTVYVDGSAIGGLFARLVADKPIWMVPLRAVPSLQNVESDAWWNGSQSSGGFRVVATVGGNRVELVTSKVTVVW